jgi:cation transport regulator ChaC
MHYFAYGSNMWTARLSGRIPCRFVTIARLPRHKLVFHKHSNDASSKCDAFETGSDDDVVWGVVFDILQSEKTKLDRAEGLGKGYIEKEVDLITTSGERITAVTYYADRMAIVESLSPYTWYKEIVLRGAREHGLPPQYIASSIDAVTATMDTDSSRHLRNWPK